MSISVRRSGMLVPLFSLVSTRGWGIGEFLDLPVFSEWLAAAGQNVVQILPITEIPEEETSPYSALTAMALDPIYITLSAVEDFAAIGGENNLDAEARTMLDGVRRASRIDYRRVRVLKSRCLRRAHQHFVVSGRADRGACGRFETFASDESWWLDDYALFQALRQRHGLRAWWDWPQPLARRDADALVRARDELAGEIDYRKYLQWIAAEQWAAARQRSRPIRVFGDLPFMISANSPDVWTRQDQFRLDASVGVPPDAFSEDGQNWGLPPWRADVMSQADFEWMRRRATRMAQLFDGFRLDHLVGFYRTYIRPLDQLTKPFFAPDNEAAQLALGQRLVSIYQDSGAEVVAEDLGTVPDFVRRSLARLGVPGCKVLRWEKDPRSPTTGFLDPLEYPETSVATTGTHDIEPLATWWNDLGLDAREQFLATPSIARYLHETGSVVDPQSASLPRAVLDALLRALLDARSWLVILPIQDVFGWRDRINTPASITDENWTWRMPWPVDRLREIPEASERCEALASWTRAAGR